MPVPDNATALDQLIAFTGRNPAMTSPNTIKRVIDVDGAVLHADTRWGATPALVFLHYWGGSRRTWRLVGVPVSSVCPNVHVTGPLLCPSV